MPDREGPSVHPTALVFGYALNASCAVADAKVFVAPPVVDLGGLGGLGKKTPASP